MDNSEIGVDQIQRYQRMLTDLVVQFAPKVLLAIVTLVIGLWLIGWILKLVDKALVARQVDKTLSPFLKSLVGWILRIVLLISVASMVGVETTSFVAILGAAGLAVGLALQGSLANFAGGVLILIFRPYRVGDFIKAQGEMGTVREIQVFCTILTNPQNRRVIIPNGSLANGNIINLTAEETVRVDTVVGISYDADFKKAKELLTKMVEAIPETLSDPAPVIAVVELADSSVNLAVRAHCKTSDFWTVQCQILEGTKLTLDEAGISIPFPQRDIHLFQENTK